MTIEWFFVEGYRRKDNIVQPGISIRLMIYPISCEHIRRSVRITPAFILLHRVTHGSAIRVAEKTSVSIRWFERPSESIKRFVEVMIRKSFDTAVLNDQKLIGFEAPLFPAK